MWNALDSTVNAAKEIKDINKQFTGNQNDEVQGAVKAEEKEESKKQERVREEGI